MKKLIAIAAALAMAFALAGCATANFGVDSDGTSIHGVAEGGASGTTYTNITIEPGYGLCVNHVVNKGSFHVTVTNKSGTVVFDKEITDNIADFEPVDGDFDVSIEAKEATGTIDIIAYDIEAQAQADATMPDVVKDATGSESAGMANPWQEAKDAAAAGEGAGFGGFKLPENGATVGTLPVHWEGYQYMTLLAEADGAAGSAALTVRKGAKNPAEKVGYDTADVSGDYNTYAKEWTVQAGDWEVKCFGNEKGQAMKALWTSDNFSYSFTVRGQGASADTFGLDDETTAALVSAIE